MRECSNIQSGLGRIQATEGELESWRSRPPALQPLARTEDWMQPRWEGSSSPPGSSWQEGSFGGGREEPRGVSEARIDFLWQETRRSACPHRYS